MRWRRPPCIRQWVGILLKELTKDSFDKLDNLEVAKARQEVIQEVKKTLQILDDLESGKISLEQAEREYWKE